MPTGWDVAQRYNTRSACERTFGFGLPVPKEKEKKVKRRTKAIISLHSGPVVALHKKCPLSRLSPGQKGRE